MLDSNIYSPPMWYFIPAYDVPHPETLEPVLIAHTAYSLKAFERKCDAVGIDTVDGVMVDLEAAQARRRMNEIVGFVILQSEDKPV